VTGAGRDLPIRLISSVLLILVALVGAWYGGWAAALLIAATTAIVHVEWIGLSEKAYWPAAATVAGPVGGILLFAGGYVEVGIAIAVVSLVAAAATSGTVWRPLGVVYAAALGFALLLLRSSAEFGFVAIMILFAVVWATDCGAFFVGRLVGGAKLWPSVSPRKTWSGAAGGLAGGIAAGAAMAPALGLALSGPMVLTFALLSIAAQFGDLFESMLKRRFGAKDSGRLLPGHGGFMDRVDGLVFAAVAAVALGWLGGGHADLAAGLVQW